jgi:predicted O-methyltransferase YrrM
MLYQKFNGTTMNEKFNYQFTMNFSVNGGSITNISHIINHFGVPNNFCEVGVYEGLTTFWLSDNYTPHNKKLQIYGIDYHTTSVEIKENLKDIQSRFLHNMEINSHKNIHYINKKSEDGLIDLINQNKKFELIYIDGDHTASCVLTDLVLSWKLLIKGGVILCDDATTWKYTDKNNTSSNQMSPRLAIETFIQCNWHKLKVLWLPDSSQTAFEKLED